MQDDEVLHTMTILVFVVFGRGSETAKAWVQKARNVVVYKDSSSRTSWLLQDSKQCWRIVLEIKYMVAIENAQLLDLIILTLNCNYFVLKNRINETTDRVMVGTSVTPKKGLHEEINLGLLKHMCGRMNFNWSNS